MRTVSGDPWAKAVDAYAAGDDKSAILHLGAAIYAEPHREELRMLLSGLLSRQSNPLALFPERPLNPAEALVYALALDWVGRKEEALRLILKLSARPQPALLPVLVAATAGSLFTTISPQGWAVFLSTWMQRIPGLRAEAEMRPWLSPLLMLADRAVAAWPSDGTLAAIFLALLRKDYRDAEVLARASTLWSAAPGAKIATMMAHFYLAREEQRQAASWYEQSLTYSEDEGIWNELGDIYLELGEMEVAQRWYERVLAKNPRESWALASYHFCCGDAQVLKTLEDGGNPRARQLSPLLLPWQRWIPAPPEPAVREISHLLAEGEPAKRLSGPASASAVRSIAAELARRGLPAVVWEGSIQSERSGEKASEEVLKAVRVLAGTPYDRQRWAEAGARLGEALQAPVSQWVAAMSEIGEVPEELPAWSWQRRLQVAAALVLCSSEEGRRALGEMVGNGDWSGEIAEAMLKP